VGGGAAGSTRNLDLPIEANTVFVVKPNVRKRTSEYRGETITWADTVVVTPTGARRMGKRPEGLISIDC
jgi:hypothetical protein